MNNKAFTLIELLGVIIILSLLILLVLPKITGSVKKYSIQTDELMLSMVVDATKFYIEDNSSLYPKENENRYCIKLNELIDKQYLKLPIKQGDIDITSDMSVQVTYKDGFNYELMDNSECKVYFYPYKNGDIVYFDVNKGKSCTEEEYKKSYDSATSDYLNSVTGYNGITKTNESQNNCLKFYAFNDTGKETVNLLLDHNTTEMIAWYSSATNNGHGPKEVIEQLYENTKDWSKTIITPKNYTMNQIGQTSNANYTVDYSQFRARLITIQEVAEITGKQNWDETLSSSGFYYFDSLSGDKSPTCGDDDVSGCKFGWLYDRTSTGCLKYGCLNNAEGASGTMYGYWTSSSDAASTTQVWIIYPTAGIGRHNTNNAKYGVRPVIEVLKSRLKAK